MRSLWSDIRYSAGSLRSSPGFTTAAVLALALGIGADTAIFSLLNAVLLRPLPFDRADQLVEVSETGRNTDWMSVDYSDFLDWRGQNQAFDRLAITAGFPQTLTGLGPAENVPVGFVSASFLRTLGVEPLIGRDFTSQDDTRGAAPVAIVTHAFWKTRLGGRAGIAGTTLALNRKTYTLIGVLPPGFRYHRSADVYTPFANCLDAYGMEMRGNHNNAYVIARRKAGVSVEQAQAQLDTIARRLAAQYPGTNAGIGVRVRPLRELLVGNARKPMLVLGGAVAFVLLIACVNVANLLLARSTARRKEIAIRAALGASRLHLVRQMLVESVLLSGAAGLLGLIAAGAALAGLAGALPWGFVASDLKIDFVVLGFVLAVSVLTGIAFGLLPALQVSNVNLIDAIRDGARTGPSGARHTRLRSSLVVAEVAMATVLLVCAGLLMNSLYRLLRVNHGYNTEHVLTVELGWPYNDIGSMPELLAFNRRAIDRVQALPGVLHAGGVWPMPLSGASAGAPFYLDGRPVPRRGDFPEAEYHVATPDYFRAAGIPLLKGRAFTDADTAPPIGRDLGSLLKWFSTANMSAVVGETMARRYWPDQNPVGQRFRFGTPEMNGPWLTVVGVVADTRTTSLEKPAGNHYYFCAYQNPRELALIVRTAGDPGALAGAVRGVIRELDGNVPVTSVRTLEEVVSSSVTSRRANVRLIGIFAGLALLLAAVGIYGVVSYTVGRRTHEIGIRMALGAARVEVLGMVLKQAGLLALTGVAIGAVGALIATRLLSSMLFGVTAADPATFLAVSAILVAVALAASAAPARRATRVDPVVALRSE